MLVGLVTTMVLVVGTLGLMIYRKNHHVTEKISFHRHQILGEYGIEFIIGSILLLWIVPWGIIVVFPVALLISIISPAGRQSWQQYGKIRAYLITAILVITFASGFVPAPQPIAPDKWGSPLLEENPNAPLYPAGKQYTWVMLPSDGGINVEIVQSMTIRTPHQFTKFSLSSTSFDLANLLNMQESRLKQAVELLDEQIVLNLDPEEMRLVEIKTAQKHDFFDTVTNTEYRLDTRLYELRSLTLSPSSDGLKVGEVICVGSNSWGGELNLLVIVRPLGHSGLMQDRFAETLVVEWISAK